MTSRSCCHHWLTQIPHNFKTQFRRLIRLICQSLHRCYPVQKLSVAFEHNVNLLGRRGRKFDNECGLFLYLSVQTLAGNHCKVVVYCNYLAMVVDEEHSSSSVLLLCCCCCLLQLPAFLVRTVNLQTLYRWHWQTGQETSSATLDCLH